VTGSDAPVSVTDVNGVRIISINRPERRNAVNLAAAELMAAAFDELDARADLRAAILTGSGGPFSAGMDLTEYRHGIRPVVAGRGFAGFVEHPPRKPLIAAVEGWALGGGFEMVLACDLVVAGAGARFGLPEVRRGLAARGGGALRLPRAVALEVLLTGDPIDGARAERLGLINHVTEDGAALAVAQQLAVRIARNAPLAVAASKLIATAAHEWPDAEAFARQDDILDPVFASTDAREGVLAFAEKRDPVWTGR
jgi:enoyl-CoA hydratase